MGPGTEHPLLAPYLTHWESCMQLASILSFLPDLVRDEERKDRRDHAETHIQGFN